MAATEEFTFTRVILILQRNYKKLIAITLLGFAAGFLLCFFMPTKYGYTALLQVADLERLEAYLLGRALNRGGVDRVGETEYLAYEVESYLSFKYLAPYAFFAKGATLKTVKIHKPGNMMQFITQGTSLEQAKDLLTTIVDDLQQQFQTKIEDIKRFAAARLSAISSQIDSEKKTLKDISGAIQNIGYSAILLTQKESLNRELATLEAEYNKIEHGIAPQKIYDFRYLEITPLRRGGPVFPNVMAIVSVFGFLFLVLGINLVFLGEIVSTAVGSVSDEFSNQEPVLDPP